MKKIILKFVYVNIDIFNFFFPMRDKIDLNQSLNKKKFSIKFYNLFQNFSLVLKINFLLFLILIQSLSLIFHMNFFKNLKTEKKNNLINKISTLNINSLSRGLLAIKSQSIIIYFSIFKSDLNHER